MAPLLISNLIGSSHYQAISDDALKDEDYAAWVVNLDPETQQVWIEHVYWMRLVDRLAEQDLLSSENTSFQSFMKEWKGLYRTGQVQPGCYQDILTNMRVRWLVDGHLPQKCAEMRAWNRYIEAIHRYHSDSLKIDTVEQFTRLLVDLGGSFFQVFPLLPDKYRAAVRCFGAMDYFYNVMRDIAEDAEQNICYLPSEILQEFGLSQTDILNRSAGVHPGFQIMMESLLESYLPALRQKARKLLVANDLPLSWKIFRDWSLHRYNRIETVMRRCNYDFTEFPLYYWSEVRQELPVLIDWVRQFNPSSSKGTPFYIQTPAMNAYTRLAVIATISSRLHASTPRVKPSLHPRSKCLL
jgi:phytoene synthase